MERGESMAREPFNTTIERKLQDEFTDWAKRNGVKKNDVIEVIMKAILNGDIVVKPSFTLTVKKNTIGNLAKGTDDE